MSDRLLHRLLYFLISIVFLFNANKSGLCQENFQLNSDSVVVQNILILGNTKTKENTILRELDFKEGDRLPLEKLAIILLENEKRLESTILFTYAKFNITHWDTERGIIGLELHLREGWYIYPAVVFELADRSFNVWWKDENFSMSRVNYGLRLDHFNLTGNKDRLKIKLHTGYTNKAEIKYDLPYIWGGWGMGGEIFYSDAKEVAGNTIDNRLAFYRNEEESVILRRWRIGLSMSRRKNAFRHEQLKVYYWHNRADDFVLNDVNPNFFLNGNTTQAYPEVYYEWTYDKRLFPFYAEGGYQLFAGFQALGIGLSKDVNLLHLFVGGSYSYPITPRVITTSFARLRWNVYNQGIPYYNNAGLGYGTNFVRGFELYVVDGSHYALLKQALSFRLLRDIFDYSRFVPVKAFKVMPMQLYLRFSAETGYVTENNYSINNPLANRWHSGYGVALDLILYQSFNLGFEYNFNDLGESGFFLKFSMSL